MTNQKEALIEALNDAVSGANPKILDGFTSEPGQGPITDFGSRRSSIFGLRKRNNRDGLSTYEQAHVNEELLGIAVEELPQANAIVRRGNPKDGVYGIVNDKRNNVFGFEVCIPERRTDLAQGVVSNVLWLSFSGLTKSVKGSLPPVPFWVVGVNDSKRLQGRSILVFPLNIGNLNPRLVYGNANNDGSGRFDEETSIGANTSGSSGEWGEFVLNGIERIVDVFDPSTPRPGDNVSGNRNSRSGKQERGQVNFSPLDLFQLRISEKDLERIETNTRLLATGAMQGIVSADGDIVINGVSEGSLNNITGSKLIRHRNGNVQRVNPADPRAVRLTDEQLERFHVWEHVASLAASFNVTEKILEKL